MLGITSPSTVQQILKSIMLLTELPAELLVIILAMLSQEDASRLVRTCRTFAGLRRFYSWVMNERQFLRCKSAASELHLRPADNVDLGQLLQKLQTPRILRDVRTLHINKWVDVKQLLSKTNIRVLYCYGNKGSLPTLWPTTLRTLVIRDIVTAKLEGNFPELQTLSCNNSRMAILPEMPKLRALYARRTELEQIPEYYDLQRVNISHTRVRSVPELRKLTHLDISHTLVPVLPNGLINLEHLNVSSSRVIRLPFPCPQLRVLKAVNTGVHIIPIYPRLEVLYIKGSQVIELPTALLRLRHLDVSVPSNEEIKENIGKNRMLLIAARG